MFQKRPENFAFQLFIILLQFTREICGCSSVAKFSKWLLCAKKMNYRSLANDFHMFNKWFSLLANEFYIQEKNYIFSNLKFVFSNISFIFNNLSSSFNEMKFIKLKSFTFSKPNEDVTKYTSKSIQQNKRSGL